MCYDGDSMMACYDGDSMMVCYDGDSVWLIIDCVILCYGEMDIL